MRFLAGFISALVVAAIVVIAAVKTGAVPANADRGPLIGEKWAAGTSLDATLNREAPKTAPFQPTAADLAGGAKLYVQNCAVCHGSAHSTSNAIARGFYIKAPQFNRRKGVTDDPVGETYWKIEHGIAWTAMPSFRNTLQEHELWQIAWFLKDRDELTGQAKAIWEDPSQVPPPTPLPSPTVAATPALK
jgi:mono/diheme cytochrome c family protein